MIDENHASTVNASPVRTWWWANGGLASRLGGTGAGTS